MPSTDTEHFRNDLKSNIISCNIKALKRHLFLKYMMSMKLIGPNCDHYVDR